MPNHKILEINRQKVGKGRPCFFIAEAGVNHNGNIEIAKKLIDVAANAKADAVKFQTFKADLLAAPNAPKAQYQAITTDQRQSQTEMLRALELSKEDFYQLKRYCEVKDIVFLSSPFDESSADLLDELDVPAYKVPSGETTNLPLLKHIGYKQRPIILSTGMSYLNEVAEAVKAIYQTGNYEIALLHCTSNYPAMPVDVNLTAMTTLQESFKVPVGFSDHTTGLEIPLAAVAMGACVIEKHFTLDKNMSGPDHSASLEPTELGHLINSIRNIELALGSGIKKPANSEFHNREIIRKSIYLKTDKKVGDIISESDLISLRPSGGISPSETHHIIGKTLTKSISTGSMLSWDDIK